MVKSEVSVSMMTGFVGLKCSKTRAVVNHSFNSVNAASSSGFHCHPFPVSFFISSVSSGLAIREYSRIKCQ